MVPDIPIPPTDTSQDETDNVNDPEQTEQPDLTGTEQPDVVSSDTDVTVNAMGNAYEGQPNLDTNDPESEVYDGPETTVDKDYTYATYTDPARQRDPNGVYLDDLERNKAEVIRAKIEGREPQLGKDAPAYGGDVILTVQQAAKQLPGDFTVPTVRTLPVSVGVPSEDDE